MTLDADVLVDIGAAVPVKFSSPKPFPMLPGMNGAVSHLRGTEHVVSHHRGLMIQLLLERNLVFEGCQLVCKHAATFMSPQFDETHLVGNTGLGGAK